MKRTYALLLVVFLVVGCGEKPSYSDSTSGKEAERPKLSQVFQNQLVELLKHGSELTSATEEGVNYSDYNSMLSDVRGTFSLMETLWPEDFEPDAKARLDEAIAVWNFESGLWNKKINRKVWYYEDALDALVKTPEDFQELINRINLMGDLAIDPDDEVGKGMAYASGKFKEARTKLLTALP